MSTQIVPNIFAYIIAYSRTLSYSHDSFREMKSKKKFTILFFSQLKMLLVCFLSHNHGQESRYTFWKILEHRMSPITLYTWFVSHNSPFPLYLNSTQIWPGKNNEMSKIWKLLFGKSLLKKETKETKLHWSKLTSCNGSSPNFYKDCERSKR